MTTTTLHPQPAASTVKLHEAMELLNEAAREKRAELRLLFDEKYTDLRTALGEASDESVGRIRRMGEAATDRVKQSAASVDESVHENPWPYIGAAALAALVVGYSLGRRR